MADANPFDNPDLGKPANAFDDPNLGKPSGVIRRTVGDAAVGLAQGMVTLPQTALSLADAVTGGAVDRVGGVIRAGADRVVNAVGDAITGSTVGRDYGPTGALPSQGMAQTNAALGELYSPESKAATAAAHAKSVEYGRAGEDAYGSAGKVAGEFAGAIVGAAQNPSSLIPLIGQSAPSMVIPMAVTGKVIGAVGERAMAAAIEAGASKEAALAAGRAAATKFAEGKAGIATASIAEGAVGGGQNASQAKSDVMDMPEAKLLELQPYKDLLAQGVSPADARLHLAEAAEARTALVSGALSTAAGPIAGGFEARAGARMAGGELAAHVGPAAGIKAGARNAGAEALQETFQSAGEQMGQNYGMRAVDPNQSLLEGVGEQAGQGALAGGLMGAGTHALTSHNPAPVVPPGPIAGAAQTVGLLPSPGQVAIRSGQSSDTGNPATALEADRNAMEINAARAAKEAELAQFASHGVISAAAANAVGSGVTDAAHARRQDEIAQTLNPTQPLALPAPVAEKEKIDQQKVDEYLSTKEATSLTEAQRKSFEGEARGHNLIVVPHPSGSGYTTIPASKLSDRQTKAVEGIQRPDQGQLPSPTGEVPGAWVAPAGRTPEPQTYGNMGANMRVAGQEWQNDPRARLPVPKQMPIPDEKRAAQIAEQKTQETGREHVVVPHPMSATRFAVAPVPQTFEGTATKVNDSGTSAPQKVNDTLQSGAANATKEAAPTQRPSEGVSDNQANGARPGEGAPGVGVAAEGAQAVVANSPQPSTSAAISQPDAEANQAIGALMSEAATSPENDRSHPTAGQSGAGNYKKVKIPPALVGGLPVTIENPAGSVRVAKDGSWASVLGDHYGYVRAESNENAKGNDGDHIDISIGSHPATGKVFVVDQNNADGSFDEHKIRYGYPSAQAAEAAYRRDYPADHKGFGGITETTVPELKTWLKEGDKSVPFADRASGKAKALDSRHYENQDVAAGFDETNDPDSDPLVKRLTGEPSALITGMLDGKKIDEPIGKKLPARARQIVAAALHDLFRLAPKSMFDKISAIHMQEGEGQGDGTYRWQAQAIAVHRRLLLEVTNGDKHAARALRGILIHEAWHAADEGADTFYSSIAPSFAIAGEGENRLPVGGIIKEAFDAYNRNADVASYLDYPFRNLHDTSLPKGMTEPAFSVMLRNEVFAQLGRLYVTNPTLLRRTMPKSYLLFEGIVHAIENDKRGGADSPGRAVQQALRSLGADGVPARNAGRGGRSADQGGLGDRQARAGLGQGGRFQHPTEGTVEQRADGVHEIRRSVGQPFQRGQGAAGQVRVLGLSVPAKATFSLSPSAARIASASGIPNVPLLEVSPAPAARGAAAFHAAISASKEGNPFSASVYVYDQSEYGNMRLFLTADGKAGFALKGNDIVSVFNNGAEKGIAHELMMLAVQEGGRRLDAFDTVLPRIYAVHGFEPAARLGWNDEYAPPGWDKKLYERYNGGEPDVVFMTHTGTFDAYQSAAGKTVADYDAAVAEQNSMLGEKPDALDVKVGVLKDVPEIKPVVKNLLPAEHEGLRRDTAKKLVDILSTLPKSEEMAAVALAGKAKRGWYRYSAEALTHTFGPDAPRFAALLAAMSPQTSVESNLRNALRTWKNWTEAGRPLKRSEIFRIMGDSVEGNKLTDSVLPAWINNSVRALNSMDPGTLTISGPKVNSFFRNLIGHTEEVTNDAWMATYALVDQKIFAGGLNAAGDNPGKGPGYLAMSARVREAARKLSKLTGENWTPAEVQETIWSWAKTVYEMASVNKSARDLVRDKQVTDALINATPDFRTLFNEGTYAEILRQAGYGDQLATLDRVGRAGHVAAGAEGSEAQGKASPFAPGAQEKLLDRAAGRLDKLRAQRAEASATRGDAYEGDIATEADDNIDIPGFDAPPKADALDANIAQTVTPEFMAWFGDSKVVDANGRPLVVYHGTGADFDTFKRASAITRLLAEIGRHVSTAIGDHNQDDARQVAEMGTIWFTDDTLLASQYAGRTVDHGEGSPNVMPVYLSFQRPLIIDHDAKTVTLPSGETRQFDAGSRSWALVNKPLIHWARAARADGLILRGQHDAAVDEAGSRAVNVYVSLKNGQAKSAIGNSGAFNPNKASILDFQLRDTVTHGLQDALTTQRSFNLWDRTVGTQLNKALKNPMFKRVYDGVQNFLNDSSQMMMEAADLAPDLLPKLEGWRGAAPSFLGGTKVAGKADLAKAADAVFQGTLNKVTHATAAAGGMTDAQFALYQQARKAIDRSLDTTVASEAVKQAKGQLPQAVLDQAKADGNPWIVVDALANIAQKTETQQQVYDTVRLAAAKVEDMKREGYAPLQRFGQYTVHVVNPDGSSDLFTMHESQREANAFARAARAALQPGQTLTQGVMSQEAWKLFQGTSPDTMEIFAEAIGASQSEVMQKYIKLAANNRSVLKRMLQRKEIAGFQTDLQRTLAQFITSNARAAAKNYHWGEVLKAANDIPKEMGDVKDEAVKLKDYLEKPQDEAGAIRGLLFIQFLGGSIASALTNATQPVMMTLPWLAQHGGAIKAAAQLIAAARIATGGAISDPVLKAAMERATKEGIVAPHEVAGLYAESIRNFGSNMHVRRALKAWGSLFSVTEAFNRRITFVAAFRTAVEQGIADPYAFATQAIAETQGVYNKGNKPNWARGAVGGTLFTFKQYSVAYMELLNRLPLKQKALAAAVLVLAAGLQGLPGIENLDDLIDTIMQSLGYSFNSKKAMREWAIRTLGDTAGNILVHGVSAIPGVPLDFQARLGVANLFPGTGIFKPSEPDKSRQVLEFFGPAGSQAKSVMDAVNAAQNGDGRALARSMVPLAVQNVLKAMDMSQTGFYRNNKGERVIDTDAYDAMTKAVGFQPQKVARQTRITQDINQNTDLAKGVETNLVAKMARAIFERDPELMQKTRAEWLEWNQTNPSARIMIKPQQVHEKVKAMMETREIRTIKGAPKELRGGIIQELRG